MDTRRGTNLPSCGEYATSACADISVAIGRAKNGGSVHATGKQVLERPVVLSKSITIYSTVEEGMVITTRFNHDMSFAFLLNSNVRLNINRIDFLSIRILKMEQDCFVHLRNISATNCHKALILINNGFKPKYVLRISGSTFKNTSIIITTKQTGRSKGTRQKVYFGHLSKVIILYSTFKKTGRMKLFHVSLISIRFCVFEEVQQGGIHGGAMSIRNAWRTKIVNSVFRNSTVKSKGGFIHLLVGKELEISNCKFSNGAAEDIGGVLYLNQIRNRTLIMHSSFDSSSSLQGGAVALLNVQKTAHIMNCSFTSNNATVGGALYSNSFLLFRHRDEQQGESNIPSTKITLENCTFALNEASSMGQAIYANEKISLHNVRVKGGDRIGATHIHLESEKVHMQHVDFTLLGVTPLQSSLVRNGITIASSDINMQGVLRSTCPAHYNPVKEVMGYRGRRADRTEAYIHTLLITRCETCHANKYTLRTGSITFANRISNATQTESTCLQCPSGAGCNGNLKPIDNYWGYVVSATETMFLPCPKGYCCSALTKPCTSYQTCNHGRSGNLCGLCDVGYFQSFVTKGCIEKSKHDCHLGVFIFYFATGSLLFAVILTFLAPGIQLAKTALESRSTDVAMDEGGILIQSANQMDNKHGPIPLSAYITIVYLFFQIASMVHVKIHRNSGTGGSGFKEALFAFFNFRFSLHKEVCPSKNLTLPNKEFLNILLKLCSLFNLFLFLGIWKISITIKSCIFSGKPKSDSVTEIEISVSSQKGNSDTSLPNDRQSQNCSLSFISVLKIGFIKLVKLNFTSISKFSLKMIHCVAIGGKLYLYTHANLECYTWWQYVIMFALLPILILFPTSFGMALTFLKEGFISTRGFLVASIFPPFTLTLYGKKHLVGLVKPNISEEERKCSQRVLELEEMLLKETDGKLRWPVVQLYRNLFVVVVDIFIHNPVYRSIIFIPLFVLFLLHDRYRIPYKHPSLNFLQSQSSALLLITTACNIPAAFSTVFDVMAIPNMHFVVTLLEYVESLLFLAMPASLLVLKVYECFRKRGRRKYQE